MATPSLRILAGTLGLSHTTVSEALRNSPRVLPATRARVLAAAKAAGYRHNPLAGALMSELRRSRAGTFRGLIGLLDLDGPDRRPPPAVRYNRELVRGATDRADELGFKVEPFVVGRKGVSLPRLDTILQSRGIRGLFLLPSSVTPDLAGLGWDRYAGIYADYIIEKPGLHSVCSDHYRSMMIALQHLADLGYRRPGLAIHAAHDDRLLNRWQAAFNTYLDRDRQLAPVPALVTPSLDEASFAPWFASARPDVVLCHNSDAMRWMQNAGARIPDTHGFCSLNIGTATIPCAGLDLQPRLLAARGVEMLIAQLHRNEYGAPETPSTTTIPARWVDGETLRPKSRATKRKSRR
jgi:LacI family transcriptional regulator